MKREEKSVEEGEGDQVHMMGSEVETGTKPKHGEEEKE